MLVIYTILAAIYGRAPIYAVNFPGEIPDPVFLQPEFILNDDLATGTKFEGISGPESIVEYNRNLYTGLADGRIVKIEPGSDGKIGTGALSQIAFISNPGLPTTMDDATRGRPLGLRMRDDMLFVADAIYGIYSVNVTSRQVSVIVQTIDASPALKFPNDIELSSDGMSLYFTDVSAKFSADEIPYIELEGTCDGRVFKYDFMTGLLSVVMDGLCSPNGLQFSPDQTRMFIAETFRNRVRIVDTSSWDTLKFVWLPTYTDNIRLSNNGNFLVAGSVQVTFNTILVRRQPAVRQWLASAYSKEELSAMNDNSFNAAFEMDQDGNVLKVFYDATGSLTYAMSSAYQLSDGRMVIGSFLANYMSFADVSL